MKRITALTHEFIDYVPQELQHGTLYISIAFATAAHKCCCGCGGEVVTPLSPTDWTLIFDGETVTLDPSVGNWSFKCQSHYWIRRNRIEWAPRWSRRAIEAGRAEDRQAKQAFFDRALPHDARGAGRPGRARGGGFWDRLKRWNGRRD
jgi:hypothetical protein